MSESKYIVSVYQFENKEWKKLCKDGIVNIIDNENHAIIKVLIKTNQLLFKQYITNKFSYSVNEQQLVVLSHNGIIYGIKFDNNSSESLQNFETEMKKILERKFISIYYDSGRLRMTGFFVDDDACGTGTEFYDDDDKSIKYIGEFEDALYDGAGVFYSKCGKITLEANNICAGKINGMCTLKIIDKNKNVIKTKEFDYVKANFGNIKVNSPMFVTIVAKHFYPNLDEILFNSLGLTKKVNKLYDSIKKLEEYLEKMDKNIYDIKKEKNVGCFKRLFRKCFC